jgi:trehalose synthase-fused probable maltokinase
MSTTESPFSLPDTVHAILFGPEAIREVFERKLLPAYLPRCRWFAGKARDPQRFSVRDVIPAGPAPTAARLLLVDVEYADQSTEMYLLPVQLVEGQDASNLVAAHPQAIVAQFANGVLCDALHDGAFRAALFALIAGEQTLTGTHGTITALRGPGLAGIEGTPPSRALAVEQSNSSVVYGDHVFLKLYRRLEPGINPDAEILRFLSGQSFTHTPPFAGSLEYRGADGSASVLALATGLVPNNGDAWSFTLRELGRWLGALGNGDAAAAAQVETDLLARVAQLGTRTGELHLALAANSTDADFAPEPLSVADGKALESGVLISFVQVGELIESKLETLPEPARHLAGRFTTAKCALIDRGRKLHALVSAKKIRTHGDYHLGQVLETGGDFVIIDFEGEPLRSLATRREKRSPFRDVAGMQRSFDYAAHAALDALPAHREAFASQAAEWSRKAQRTFLEAWLKTTEGAIFRTGTPAEENQLLEAFLLEKALYEVLYEINNRPAWLPIPLAGVLRLLASE